MPEPEPKALSTEYHKARKQLLLWAGILLIWELVGVDLSKAEGAGGNVGAIITAIRSPQAVPWVLLILVAYFLFKVTVEWYQCSLSRRTMRVSKIDFFSAWILSLVAYVLYAGQALSHVQLADLLQRSIRAQSILGGLVLGLGTGFVVTYVWLYRRVINFVLLVSSVIIVTAAIFWARDTTNWTFLIAAFAGGAALMTAMVTIIRAKPWRVHK